MRTAEYAWLCKEEFTPDGKACVRRERRLGNSVIRGIVTLATLVVILVLVLTGHTFIAAPVSFGGLLGGLGSLFRK
jgi:hypothetical protein